MFYFFLWILFVIFVQYCYEYSTYKTHYNQAKKLKESYEKWFTNSSNDKPNNAIFKELYKIVYNKEIHPLSYKVGNRAILQISTIDAVASFPTRDNQVAPTIFALLDNIYDHFYIEFEKRRTIKYFIDLYIFAPRNLLKWLGIPVTNILSKILSLIFWIISPAITIFREQLINWIMNLFSK